MDTHASKFAVVTGASSGIGFELAQLAVRDGFDVLVVADEPDIQDAAARLQDGDRTVEAMQLDLATIEGIDRLYDAIRGREVDALFANAGRGLGHGFLDQDWQEARRVIDTNVTGTVYLIQKIARDMRALGSGRILITGSIAGFMPGTFQAVYNGSKAFLDSFAYALRNELKDSGVTVSVLMPGVTDTRFFERADLLDTKVGAGDKQDPAEVAKTGYDAMMSGESGVVAGFKNKLQAAVAHITPDTMLAEQRRKMAEPGSANR